MRISSRFTAVMAAAAFVVSALAPAAADVSNLSQIKARGTLRVGVKYDAPPFGLLDPKTNQVNGFDIDIAHQIAKSIFGDPNKVELVQVSSGNRIPQVENGNIDMFVATATITNDRLKQIAFSDVYYRAGQSLLVRKDSPIKSYHDLGGHSVCSITGSTPEQTIRRLAPKANVVVLESYPECFTALRGGRVDAVTTDNVLLTGLRDQDPANYKLVGGLFTYEPYGIGIAKGNDTVVKAVNDALAQMGSNGTYGQIHQRWLHEPLPRDWKSWFNEPPDRAAEQFAREHPSTPAAAPAPSPAASK